MTTSRRAQAPAPSADQLMRRMLHAIARLHAACARDAAELGRLDDQLRQDVAAAEKEARAEAALLLARAPGSTGGASLGGELRADLDRWPIVEVRHVDPGPPPVSLSAAIEEWSTLAPYARRRVNEVQAALATWHGRLFKREKSMPTVPEDLWRELDLLDSIHRAVPVLEQAFIADRVREVSGAAEVTLAAESEQRFADQRRLAGEVRAATAAVESSVGLAGRAWSDPGWGAPAPADAVQHYLRLGDLLVDLPPALGVGAVPALAVFPLEAGLALASDVADRDSATGLLKALLLRLLAAVPPGGLHLKVVDPVSLGQSVAEFRHLAEYDSRLVDEKTWTAERDIERLMDDLSSHLEVVISSYLRGQFESIDDYNRHAGEVAEPYRVLAVFDYPTGFSERAQRQLLSLIENGPRCGVYTVLHHDRRAERSDDRGQVPIERLVHSMQKVEWTRGRARLRLTDPLGEIEFELVPDSAAPVAFASDGHPETGFAALLAAVGAQVRERHARPPAVTLDSLLPVLSRNRGGVQPEYVPDAAPVSRDPATWWGARTAGSAVAPLGRSGAQGVTAMHFSSTEVAGGAIMVGLPRSGKTTSLHALILTMAMLYPPEELELYLIDAKHGVEFKVYEELPHARMVSVHSEREFSLAVLKSLEAEIRRRAELMKADGAGRANLTEYRAATGAVLPRIVLVMDEFHELFEEPDNVGMAAFDAFSNIVRMGPFSGVHVVVASQTLSSMPAMDRPTLMLLPQRVAFMCNEYDAEIVMGDTNKAPRLLARTGEGLFNPSRGDESRNQPFQGLYVSTEERGALIGQLARKAQGAGWTRRARVFDGDAVVPRPPDALHLTGSGARLTVPIGEPFTLAERDVVVLRRSRGAGVLIVGDREDLAGRDPAVRGVVHSFLLAAAAQRAGVTVVDFMGDDEEVDGTLSVLDVAAETGAAYVRSRGLGPVLAELTSTVVERTAAGEYRAPARLLVMTGLERALALSPADPFDADDSGEPAAGEQLADLLREGPEVGVHVVMSADSVRTVERRLGADVLQELTMRIAGSAASQQDLATTSGQYGDVPPLRHGQLLVGDLTQGTARRIRGYTTVATGSASPGRRGDDRG
ncbi:FtsK/SpoIIIE domain-containing protein [Blastococcus sp. SYSU D00922]